MDTPRDAAEETYRRRHGGMSRAEEREADREAEFNVRLEDLGYVDCDNCRTVGKYRRLGPNHFACKVCGEEFRTTPCPPDCPDHPKRAP